MICVVALSITIFAAMIALFVYFRIIAPFRKSYNYIKGEIKRAPDRESYIYWNTELKALCVRTFPIIAPFVRFNK